MRLRDELTKLARYGVVGIVSNLTLYLLFLALLYGGIGPVTAAGICYAGGVCFSYVLNRGWAFKSTAGHQKDLPKYLLAYGIGFFAALAGIALLSQWMAPEIAQLINIGLTAVVIYSCLRLLKFGQSA